MKVRPVAAMTPTMPIDISKMYTFKVSNTNVQHTSYLHRYIITCIVWRIIVYSSVPTSYALLLQWRERGVGQGADAGGQNVLYIYRHVYDHNTNYVYIYPLVLYTHIYAHVCTRIP